MRDSTWRSLLKTLTWRLWATPITVLLVWLISGNAALALSLGVLEFVLKAICFYLHERFWDELPWFRSRQPAAVVWLTGLSGAGKTTIAKEVVALLEAQDQAVQWLDGDVTRDYLPNLGFSRQARDHNVQTAGFIARTLEARGVTVVASYIAPYRETRDKVRRMCQRFVEVYVATDLATCETRDVKGLYAKARSGEIGCMTGVSDPYEAPDAAELVLQTQGRNPRECAQEIVDFLHHYHA